MVLTSIMLYFVNVKALLKRGKALTKELVVYIMLAQRVLMPEILRENNDIVSSGDLEKK